MRISWPSAARYANSCHTPGNTRKDPLFSLFAPDIECPFPFFPWALNKAPTAIDACVVYQKIDVIGIMLSAGIFSELLNLGFIGYIAEKSCDECVSRVFFTAESYGLIHARIVYVADSDAAALLYKLSS